MTFEEILDQAMAMLQRRGRLTYSTLKRQFQLDDAALEDLKNELIYGQRLAVDEEERVLVWRGEPLSAPPPTTATAPGTRQRVGTPAPGLHSCAPRREDFNVPQRARRRTQAGHGAVCRPEGVHGAAGGARPRGGPPAAGPGPGAHDRGRAPLRGHRQPGDGGWDYGPLRCAHCP